MALILPLDLETMILRYAGCHYPFASMRAAGDRTLRNWFNLNIVLREFFIQPWTPTACNVLRWVPLREKEERYVWMIHSHDLHLYPNERSATYERSTD